MHVIEVASPLNFDAVLETQLVTQSLLFVLFIGSTDVRTGKSWCPDTVKAEPLIHSALESIPNNVTVLKCLVQRNEYKGNPNYPYRTHPEIRLQAIPTLIHWGKQGPKERLVEAQCYNKQLLNELIETVKNT